jgi:hypothetical protein
MNPTLVQIAGAVLFGVALVHTFSTSIFARLARRFPAHEGIFHLLGEVEVVFGLWALVMVLVTFAIEGRSAATGYVDARDFTEPLFVFAIMVIAGSRPILALSTSLVDLLAGLIPVRTSIAVHFLALFVLPLLGSLITEPAAMTLAAIMLRDRICRPDVPEPLKYATLGVLFVNVSIGGTLTPFAAPPVLMVASQWGWDIAFMLQTFGWKAALAVGVNALAVTAIFHQQVGRLAADTGVSPDAKPPVAAMMAGVVFLAGVVAFAHHPAIFMALLLFFIGYSAAYPQHHDPLILREALLVAFFLAGLVVLGGQQQWWLQPLLVGLSPKAVFYGATAMTAVTDNAALTYLGSLVEGLSDEFKYALVAGAVTGGGLTVIANVPNPAGYSILRGNFRNGTISAGGLFLAALGPTLVAIAAFRFI